MSSFLKLMSFWVLFSHAVVGSSIEKYDEVVVSPDVGGTKRASVGGPGLLASSVGLGMGKFYALATILIF